MTETLPHWALLPDGLHDLLPPQAAHEVDVVEHLMALLESHGYERVKPPLLEFEETLLGGVGAALANETFRLMDPISQRMMALRADMTVQIARLALARLSKAPRPLRLAYSGQVLRVRGSQLRPERQFAQVGAELIGAPTPYADAEIAALAAMALDSIGVNDLSLDLTVPSLVPIIRDVLREAIAAGGSSLRDFRRADGALGYFQHRFQVYGREGGACNTDGCAGFVARIPQSGRSTFFCPRCQR